MRMSKGASTDQQWGSPHADSSLEQCPSFRGVELGDLPPLMQNSSPSWVRVCCEITARLISYSFGAYFIWLWGAPQLCSHKQTITPFAQHTFNMLPKSCPQRSLASNDLELPGHALPIAERAPFHLQKSKSTGHCSVPRRLEGCNRRTVCSPRWPTRLPKAHYMARCAREALSSPWKTNRYEGRPCRVSDDKYATETATEG